MAIELNRRYGTSGATVDQAFVDQALRSYMLKVYNLMASGLALSGIVAVLAFNMGLAPYGMIASFAALGLIFVMSFGANKFGAGTLNVMYWAFVALMGFGLSYIFMVYTATSIVRVFFISAATFGAVSLLGYTTKRDLSGMGTFLLMALIGLIIASVVNIFLGSTMMQFIISIATVLIFTAMTAYDTQRIKSEFSESAPQEITQKQAIFGAVSLYINFINIFQALLSLLGNRE
jgi:FtsH-binding integral membrane protein